MKVCVFSGSSFEKNYASYHLMRDLIEKLIDDEHEVCLIQKCFGKSGYLPPELENRAGITVCDIMSNHQIDQKNLIKRMIADIQYYLKTVRAIRKFKDCDVFFLQSNNVPWLPIAMIRMLARKPIVYNVQDIFPQNAIYSGMLADKSVISRFLLRTQKWALKHSTAIITISEDMKTTLIENGASAQHVLVAYNWANEVCDETVLAKKQEDGKYHVVYAGNIGRMQNVQIIIRAAALLKDHPDIQFDIYGNGALKDSCMELSKELKTDNLRFYEPVPSGQAHALYENADLNIVPLATDIIKTALPSKTAICIACGKPVVFAVGEESCLARMAKESGFEAVNSNDEHMLAERILFLKTSASGYCDTTNLEIRRCFQKNASVQIYVDVLSKAANHKLIFTE